MNPLPVFADNTLTIGGVAVSTELLVVLIAIVLAVGSRLVRTLTVHQQKMAEIFNRPQPQNSQEVQAMRQELELLKSTVSQQALLIESLTTQQRQLAESVKPGEGLAQRLKTE